MQKYYAGTNDRGATYYFCDSPVGIFFWGGPQGWILSELGNVRQTMLSLGVSKAEKLTYRDIPLFMFKSRPQ